MVRSISKSPVSLFATEFSTSADLTQSVFTAEIIGWLRGIKASRILAEATEKDLDGDAPLLRAASGETLAMLRMAGDGNAFALGFRHDIPDGENRIWRTEGVMRRTQDCDIAILRIRGQCIAAATIAHLQPPRRPHLIRALLERGMGGTDGVLPVQTTPHLLGDSDADQLLAADITEGKATRHLPVVYVSAIAANQWIAGRAELTRLALELAGVAHVVLEPHRDVSFRLKNLTNGRNAYGGTIGIAMPQLGIVRRLFIGWALPDAAALLAEIRATALELRTDMGRQAGWDWHDLQDATFRAQRKRDRSRLSTDENDKLWQEELAAKDDRIAGLEADLAVLRRQKTAPNAVSDTPAPWLADLGPELYPSEFNDRMRAALVDIVQKGADQSWDARSLALFTKMLQSLPVSQGLTKLREELRRATLDNKKISKDLPALLQRYGYFQKSDKTHIRMEADPALIGLPPITIPKTPGDHRTGENQRSQIEEAFGLKRLDT